MKSKDVLIGVSVALVVAAFSFLASKYPDGLERVAENLGFLGKEKAGILRVFGDYAFPGIANEKLSLIIAGFFGALAVFFVTVLTGRLIKQKP